MSTGIRTVIYFKPSLGGEVERAERLTLSGSLRAIASCWAVLALIVLVVGGIWGGFFTPTEAGAVGAAGGFLLACTPWP